MEELASQEAIVFHISVSANDQGEHFKININRSIGEDFTATA